MLLTHTVHHRLSRPGAVAAEAAHQGALWWGLLLTGSHRDLL